jgi:hypothetical protein
MVPHVNQFAGYVNDGVDIGSVVKYGIVERKGLDMDRQTSTPPIIVDGVTFNCFHVGVLKYVWRSEDGKLEIRSRHSGGTYTAMVNGDYIWTGDNAKRFRSQRAAMRAAVAAQRESNVS